MYFFIHTAKFLKDKKLYRIFIQQKFKKYVLACILDFNNQFIKAMRIKLIFQTYQKKNYFVFF